MTKKQLRRSVSFLPLVLLSCAGDLFAAPYISALSGIVQKRTSGYQNWEVISQAPATLAAGDSVRTGSRAGATLVFDDGSRIELSENGSFTVEASNASQGVRLSLGRLRAFIQKLSARQFVVRTPTAVCSVRGTEFLVAVQGGGHTTIDLYKGLLAVADQRGQEILLHPNERLEVGKSGVGTPSSVPTQAQVLNSQFHSVMRREMVLDMTKEQVQAAAASEIKLAEFQQGKALVDVFGKRVRIEEYIIRPQANQFKLVVLNERADRFDYFYYLGTFNATLPSDLRVAMRQLPGSVGTAPNFYLTQFETGRSNTVDSMIELAQGGHPVNVNGNADASDDVAFFFDSNTNAYTSVAGQNVYQTLFDKYGFYINGGLKYGWTGSNIQSYLLDATGSSNTDPITGAALAAALPARSVSTTFPDPGQIHQVIYESYSDGTSTKWDNYIIDDEGKIATYDEFQGAGSIYKERILKFNYEQVITATEFKGRKIDLVIEPKILVQSGLIQ